MEFLNFSASYDISPSLKYHTFCHTQVKCVPLATLLVAWNHIRASPITHPAKETRAAWQTGIGHVKVNEASRRLLNLFRLGVILIIYHARPFERLNKIAVK